MIANEFYRNRLITIPPTQHIIDAKMISKLKLAIFIAIILLILLSSCLVDSTWLRLVGRWQNVEEPYMEIEFTEGGIVNEYFFRELVGNGEFRAYNNQLILRYKSPCVGENQVSCSIKLEYQVNEDMLMITDSGGNIFYRKVPKRNDDLGRSTSENLPVYTSNDNSNCLHWSQAKNFNGEEKCFFGIIQEVNYHFDNYANADMWVADFGTDTENNLRLISIGVDLSQWEGICVIVHGNLVERDYLKEYYTDMSPLMINYSLSVFTIEKAENYKCE